MDLLKKIPISYLGELHEIRLINFSVDKNELSGMVTNSIKVREFENDRALISMVNVQLKKMHPSFLPKLISFQYQHVAFRLLVEDSMYNNGQNKGIFFLRSFSNKTLMVQGGKYLTDYRLEKAIIQDNGNDFSLRQGNKFVQYSIDGNVPAIKKNGLQETIGALDRAYSVLNDRIRVTQIQREKWPIEWVHCTTFKTNFFETARFEGAFKVNEMIPYKWLPPVTL